MIETTVRLRDAAEPVRKLAADFATTGEHERQLDKRVIDAIIEAGFARHFVPAQWGGSAGTFTDATDAVSLVGEGCASAAWVASVFAYSGRFASFLPEQAQSDIWADGPDHVVASALVPSGSAIAADGGWRISGDWHYISGAATSDWALVSGPLQSNMPPRFFVVPRTDFTVIDSWNSTGMRATMSNTLRIEDVFVPEYRSVQRSVLIDGLQDTTLPASQRAPLRAAGGLAFAAPILGAAAGALAGTVRHNAARAGTRQPAAEARLNVGLTHASGELAAAQLLLAGVAAACDQGHFGRQERAVHGRDAAVAANLAVTAVGRLMQLCGTAGFDEHSSVQRHWRDVNCAVSHHAVQLDAAAAAFGPMLLDQAR